MIELDWLIMAVLGSILYTLAAVRCGMCLSRQQVRINGRSDGMGILGAVWPLVLVMSGAMIIFGDYAIGFEQKHK